MEKDLKVNTDLKPKEVADEKLFSIKVSGDKGETFTFSGPASSNAVEREKVIYTLFSHYTFYRMQQIFIEQAKKAEEEKEAKGEADKK